MRLALTVVLNKQLNMRFLLYVQGEIRGMKVLDERTHVTELVLNIKFRDLLGEGFQRYPTVSKSFQCGIFFVKCVLRI